MIDLANYQKEKEIKKPTDALASTKKSGFSFDRITIKDQLFFAQNLQAMVKSGLALDKALKTLSEQATNKKLKSTLAELADNTEHGKPLADGLVKYEDIFGNFFINMVKAGELSGSLESALEQIYHHLKKIHDLKSKVVSAMIYPIVVIVAMILIGIGLVVFIVPKITAIFKDSGVELPMTTKFIIGLSDFVILHWLIIIICFFIILFLAFIALKNKNGRKRFYRLLFELPVLGQILKNFNLAKFCRTLSALLKTDIQIIQALVVTAEILDAGPYRDSLNESVDELKSGKPISAVLVKYPKIYPPIILQMIATGEETGTLDKILAEMAEFYEDDVEQTMKNLPAIIEPVLILVLGAGVAFIALAIITPMYSLTNTM